jgi:outer membrane protein assembly factor BamB
MRLRPLAMVPQLAACAVLAARPAGAADDWPQFRGPTGQGHSTARGVPLEWSESRNVRWKVPVPGSGWSSPVVAAGRVWLTSSERVGAPAAGAASLRVLAFDVQTGRQLVNAEAFRINSPGVINVKNSRASPTPIVEGDRVYVHFGADGTAALTTSGDIVWTARFPYESQHGNGGSPVLYGDLIILSADGADTAFVVAIDKHTGKVRWKTARRQPWDQAYSTPLLIRVGGNDQLVSVGAHRAAAYEPLTGREIWRVGYPNGFSNVPRPVFGDGLVYVTTGFHEPSVLAVRVDGQGDVTRTHVAWTLDRSAPLTPSPLLVDGLLYLVSDIGIATCVDARTGEVRWQQRIGGNHSASPILADGRIYFLSEEGVATVIAPGPEFRKLAVNELDGATLASMAVADQSIFIRSATHLYRIGGATSGAGSPAPQASAADPRTLLDRATTDFLAGRIAESVRGFDEVARRVPDVAPQLWQRGIALFYAGRYDDCRAQFESHRLVNPDDVENAAWHFLCVARAESPVRARAALLPVGPDPRVPMRQVYRMFRGDITPEAVLAAAGTATAPVFYAQLYVGLYLDALGDRIRALKHVSAAADERYREAGGYMHAVARVHLSTSSPGR